MKTAIGLMSGTSMDGVDVALIRTDGLATTEFGPTLAVDYPHATRKAIAASLVDAQAIKEREDRPGVLADVEELITDFHADVVNRFLRVHNIPSVDVDVLGFHGQTVLHRPQQALTVQLGHGQQLADITGIDVVHDMRARDMTAGGQGAPLVPVFHQALATSLDSGLPLAFVNIGGISNITFIGEEDELIAFDTGPGNALIDQWVEVEGGIPFDQGGKIAAEGRVVPSIARKYLTAGYFDQAIPKSLDRGDFKPLEAGMAELSDGARTLAHVTAASIMRAVEHLPAPPKQWIICGGGRLNETIMMELRALAAKTDSTVVAAEDLGFQGDMMEAQAFGYLAIRHLEGLPLTFPGTTGCDHPVTGGVLAKARRPCP